jgi:hypothetical protein
MPSSGLGNKYAPVEKFGNSHRFVKDAYRDLRASLPRPQARQQTPPVDPRPLHAAARDIHLGHIADAESIADLRAWQDEHAGRASSLPEEFFAPIQAALVCRGFEVAATDKEFLAWRDSSRKGLEKLPRGLKDKTREAYEAALLRFKEAVGAAA